MKSRRRASRPCPLLDLRVPLASALVALLFAGGCFLNNVGETYYGRVITPRRQEFRWSDGGLPQTLDPARAAAAPETDAVRALYEGLTDYDPQTLRPQPAVALKWEASPDHRVWTFYLRPEARWSNGDPVTATDFVRSWQRALDLGAQAPHARLLEGIEGAVEKRAHERPLANTAGSATAHEQRAVDLPPHRFGVEALDENTLRVRLARPDRNFPALVAHPIFRPIHLAGKINEEADAAAEAAPVVSNGAFQLADKNGDFVALERAPNYWDAQKIALERVTFLSVRDREATLAAYRAGAIDAVTNAAFEPLALKLLTPYRDFSRVTFGALIYYSFNLTRPPFDDQRVREALSLVINRERISDDVTGGATEPARKFLPDWSPEGDAAEARAPLRPAASSASPRADTERARRLFAEAGFPRGIGFPRLRLLVNRNDQQRAVAQAVSEMWRAALGVETEIVVKPWNEYLLALKEGDYDVARRSLVMQTTDEETNILTMFAPEAAPVETGGGGNGANGGPLPTTTATAGPAPTETPASGPAAPVVPSARTRPEPIMAEEQALQLLPAIPIYFSSSYALVKPYVRGFHRNLLDAPSLKHVSIDTAWKPPKEAVVVWSSE